MTSSRSAVAARGPDALAFTPLDVTVPGRCIVAEDREAFCVTRALFLEGVGLRTSLRGRVGESVRASLRRIGTFEGTIAKIEADGFVVAPSSSREEKILLARRLRHLAGEQGHLHDARCHDRITPDHPETSVHTRDRGLFCAQILDMSRSGVAVQAQAPLRIGDVVVIGETPARVVRVEPSVGTGAKIAASFLTPIPEEIFGSHFRP